MNQPKIIYKILHESASNLSCEELCEWIKKNNRLPQKNSEDSEECFLALWLNYQKTLKGNIYPSNKNIVKSYGFENLFDTEE